MKIKRGVIRQFPDLVEALAMRGDMIKRGAAERVKLAARIAALEALLEASRADVRRLEREQRSVA